jgi:hypothetical protein
VRRAIVAMAALLAAAPVALAAPPPTGMVTLHARTQEWVE